MVQRLVVFLAQGASLAALAQTFDWLPDEVLIDFWGQVHPSWISWVGGIELIEPWINAHVALGLLLVACVFTGEAAKKTHWVWMLLLLLDCVGLAIRLGSAFSV